MSDSFIHTLPLNINQAQERELEKRLDAARQIYNAALGEALKPKLRPIIAHLKFSFSTYLSVQFSPTLFKYAENWTLK